MQGCIKTPPRTPRLARQSLDPAAVGSYERYHQAGREVLDLSLPMHCHRCSHASRFVWPCIARHPSSVLVSRLLCCLRRTLSTQKPAAAQPLPAWRPAPLTIGSYEQTHMPAQAHASTAMAARLQQRGCADPRYMSPGTHTSASQGADWLLKASSTKVYIIQDLPPP